MFVLPNLFTLCSIFCGFYAITLCVEAPSPDGLFRAAFVIFIGMVLDLFDGRIARLTKTQSEFGRQLDSLADLVSFGTAPAVLLYAWVLRGLGGPGLLVSFGYVACGALRLARFNVLAGRPRPARPTPDYSVGLPIPPASGTIVALVMSLYPSAPSSPWVTWSVAAGVLALGGLMVSNVHYRTFKDLRPTAPVAGAVAALALVFGGVAVACGPAVGLAAVFVSYVAFGPVEELYWRLFAPGDDGDGQDEPASPPAKLEPARSRPAK